MMNNLASRRRRGRSVAGSNRRGLESLEPRQLMTAVDATAAYSSFVNAAYQDILGRTADQTALTFWTQASRLDFVRLPLAEALTHSQEYYSNLVRQTYEQTFGRAPESAGLAYWSAQLQQGLSDEQFQAALLASTEFYARSGGDNLSWLNAVYQQELIRSPDATGGAYWDAQLAEGASRFEAAAAIAQGNEHARREVTEDFQHYLGRAPDEAALTAFASQLTSAFAHEDFVARLVATDEYFERQTGLSPTVVPVASPLDTAMNPGIASQIQQASPQVLFLGDSITWGWQNVGQSAWSQYYGSRNAVDAGVPADTTENVLWRLDHTDFSGVQPKLAIVQIGTNNLAVDSPAAISQGIAAIVDRLRQDLPGTKILLLGILPRGQAPNDALWQSAVQTNQSASLLADNQTVFYLDLSSIFLRSDGTLNADLFLPDRLHPDAQGYEAWAAAMENEVATLLSS